MIASESIESFLEWDSERVASYVKSVLPANDQMEQLSSRFKDHDIDGSLLPYLSSQHLKDMGIEPIRIRLILKKAFSALLEPTARPFMSHGDFGGYSIASQVCIQVLSLSSTLIQQQVAGISRSPDLESFVKLALSAERHNVSPAGLSQALTSTICVDNLPRSAALGSLFESFIDDNSKDQLGDMSLTTPRNSEGSINNPESASLAYSALSPPQEDPIQFQLLDQAVDHTRLNRFSQGSILSTGIGRIVHQHLPGRAIPKLISASKVQSLEGYSSQKQEEVFPQLQNTAALPHTLAGRRPPSRFLNLDVMAEPSHSTLLYTVGVKDAFEIKAEDNGLGSYLRPHSSLSISPRSHSSHLEPVQPSLAPILGSRSLSLLPGSTATSLGSARDRTASTGSSVTFPAGSLHSEPLKQLRASKDDSCLKVLQQAMKRHHITREDWSKYVLVICYGDKERILKLAEKPVLVFKELQELGLRPAIMLRQLAEEENDLELSMAGSILGDSRLMGDIPGGIL